MAIHTKKPKQARSPASAPTKEEKIKKVTEAIHEILKIITEANPENKQGCEPEDKPKIEFEIFIADESHFSTQPYLPRGWFKKGAPTTIHTPKKRESFSVFGALRIRDGSFYWKSAKRGNSKTFIKFMTQVLRNSKGKGVIMILDNATCHKSNEVKKWLKKHKSVKLFYFPPYSPEDNPVEQVWKWIKSNLYSVYANLANAEELKKRFCRLCWRWQNKWPAHTFSPGIGIWAELL